MKKLVICGKCNIDIGSIPEGAEIWMLGTDPRPYGDVYFELHGIKIKNHDKVIYELPDEVYQMGLPINNSISALLIFSFLKGYKDVEILGCPMESHIEYLEQRPALAYVIGFLSSKGMNIQWNVIPKNKDYGKKKR